MAKLLKILVVVVALVAIAAAVLQFTLFNKRELVKGRVQHLENAIDNIAKTVKSADLLTDDERGAINFKKDKLVVADAQNLGQIDQQGNIVATGIKGVIQHWNDTQDELEKTRDQLEQTKAELAQTKADLEAARDQIVRLQGEITEKNNQIRSLNDNIASLEEEKRTLEGDIEDRDNQIAELENEKAGLEDEKAMLEAQLEKCVGASDPSRSLPPGTEGSIVSVNTEWQYAIVDLGSNQGAALGSELIVSRDNDYLSKIRLVAIRDDVSIAEVVQGAPVDQLPEGDDVVF